MNTHASHPASHSPSHGASHDGAAHDPHNHGHHEHKILGAGTLLGVLVTLLFFTILTVALSRGEAYFAELFKITIPHWVNVLVALSIAVVKSYFVTSYFMQLKYDNPINSMVLYFCLFAFALFLFFAMMDLGMRDTVYAYKSGEVQKGGQGIDATYDVPDLDANGNRQYDRDGVLKTKKAGVNTGPKPIVQWAREKRIETINGEVTTAVEAAIAGKALVDGSRVARLVTHTINDLKASGEMADLELQKQLVIDTATAAVFKEEFDEAHAHSGGHAAHDDDHAAPSNPNKSRGGHGHTPGLFTSGGHDSGSSGSHGTSPKSGGH